MRAVDRDLDLDGVSVFVREVGAGQPVLLINGIGAHTEMWRPTERALDGLRILSFDAPGTGRSDTTMRPWTMGRLARLVIAMLDRLEIAEADVVGYSFGGAVAQQFAVDAPDRVRRLVLASSFPGWGGVPGHLRALLSMGTPLRHYSRTFYEHTAGTIAGGRARTDSEYVSRLWRDRAGQVPSIAGYTQQLWAMAFWSSLPWLERIRAPTLIVVGDDDPLVPLSNPVMMAARIPNSRMFIGPGEGHFQLLDDESAGLAAIKDFLCAPRLDDVDVWRSSPPILSTEVADQMRLDGIGALPWGAISAVVRRVYA